MEQNIIQYLKKLTVIFSEQNLAEFIKKIGPDIKNLQNFRFYFSNPILWLIILTALLILSRTWGLRKAFSYCLTVSIILFSTTRIIVHLNLPIDGAGITYADIIKFLAVTLIVLISVYYFLMKN